MVALGLGRGIENLNYNPHHVSKIVKHGDVAICVLGCMISHGMGYTCEIEGKMTKATYLNHPQMGQENN